MKISIIVPVYNAEKTIKKCVDSIISQTICEIELILIDDFSKDNSYKICSELKKKYPQIILLQTEGKGVSQARNTGLRKSSGDIIGFCDADDYYESNALNRIVEEFERNSKVDIIVTGFNIVEVTGKIISKINFKKSFECTSTKLMGHVLNDNTVMGSVWNKFFRRKLLDGIEFEQSLSYCEDKHYVMKVLSKNRDSLCIVIKDRLYNYVQNECSVTHNYSNIYDKNDNLKYIVSTLKIIEDCNLSKHLYTQARYNIICHAIDTIIALNPKGRKRKLLKNEIKKNLFAFLINIWRWNIKWNIKRCFYIMKEML